MAIRPLTIQEVEYVAFSLAKKLLEWDEPIPEFGSRFPNILESCLQQPFSTYGGKNLYRGLKGKAAILFYLMIKNHPFENGNKRIAITTLLYFMYKNGRWLKLSNDHLYLFAKEVAGSDPKNKDSIILEIQKTIAAYTVSSRLE